MKFIRPTKHRDDRGYFSEIWRHNVFGVDFVQDNESLTHEPWTVRGLHFQAPPFAQAKLVRVVRGSILDVAVDLRRDSPTYGKHVAETLTDDGEQLFVPEGFAHGFMTLEPETHVIYKVSAYYSAEHDRGIIYDDPALAIFWPVGDGVRLSKKDAALPTLADARVPF